jgi:hypothetical protein
MILPLLLCLFVTSTLLAYENNTSIVYIHEELPPNTLLIPSISSSTHLQWLPSSLAFQSYFAIDQNHSLYTTDRALDREEFCEKNLCNCSVCSINLDFLQTFSTSNISIRTIQIQIEDINDHSPTFRQPLIKLAVPENVPVGYEISIISRFTQMSPEAIQIEKCESSLECNVFVSGNVWTTIGACCISIGSRRHMLE